jgi:hypothetical protein
MLLAPSGAGKPVLGERSELLTVPSGPVAPDWFGE